MPSISGAVPLGPTQTNSQDDRMGLFPGRGPQLASFVVPPVEPPRLAQMARASQGPPTPLAGARDQSRQVAQPFGQNLAVPGTPRG